MTLNSHMAWCLFCLMPATFETINPATATPCGTFAVRTGQCPTCGENMVRVFPNDGREIPAAEWQPGKDWTVIDVPTLFSQVTDSTDVRGQTAVLPDGSGGTAKWLAIARVKAAAGHFDAILNVLIQEGQGMPVAMWDQHGDGYWTIGNGHHRLIAMLLLGFEEIMICISYSRDPHRMEDTQDEDWPITPQGTRYVWALIKDALPGDVVPASDAPRYVCAENGLSECVCHCDCEIGGTPTPSWDSALQTRMEARNAAAQGVWDLIMGHREAEARAISEAQDLRAQAQALWAAAEEADAKANAHEAKANALMPFYTEAANIGAS